ncbi:MAG: transposase [Dehalococcoidia bacterium]
MARPAATANPPCPRCGHSRTVRTGRTRGRQRWLCAGCGRTFGPTTGTPLFRLRTPPAAVAQALLIVQRRGSLLAAEELTGHKYETIGRWLRRAGAHADALSDALVHDLHLTEVEVDEFWSFVHDKGGPARGSNRARPRWGGASAGAA